MNGYTVPFTLFTLVQLRMQDLPINGADHGERANNRRFRDGQSHWKVENGKLFVHFHTKEERPKVKDLNDSSPVCPRQTASRSRDQPILSEGSLRGATARSDRCPHTLCAYDMMMRI